MKIKTIKLTNFRCFESLTVNFHEQLTVLVAKNGFGKTAILDAPCHWPGGFCVLDAEHTRPQAKRYGFSCAGYGKKTAIHAYPPGNSRRHGLGPNKKKGIKTSRKIKYQLRPVIKMR